MDSKGQLPCIPPALHDIIHIDVIYLPTIYLAGAAPADLPAAVGKALKEPGLGDTLSIKSGSSLVTPPPKGFLIAFQNSQDRFLPHATLTYLEFNLLWDLGQGRSDDLPSAEKVERHQLVELATHEVQCKKCKMICPSELCPTMSVFQSRPCMGLSTGDK